MKPLNIWHRLDMFCHRHRVPGFIGGFFCYMFDRSVGAYDD